MNCKNPSPADVLILRQQLRLTQTDFGRITCASASAVCRWENGSRKMHPVLWEKYCDYAKRD